MEFIEKIDALKLQINESLIPLIGNDYVLWDIPYHNNIGDLLIWQGEIEFLKNIKYRCLDYASAYTCSFPALSSETVILLHGGGNFGDLWRAFQEFRLKVIRKYPDNKIIIFPQTVYYEKVEALSADARSMSVHENLTICTRDQASYQLLKSNFSNRVLLVPDMAFCIPYGFLRRFAKPVWRKVLIVQRKDKEFKKWQADLTEAVDLNIQDWPTFEKKQGIEYLFGMIIKLGIVFRFHAWNKFIDLFATTIYKRQLLKKGVRFLSEYEVVYSNRLHAFILCILLSKECYVIDNSYGKNSKFYETWLKDVDKVNLIVSH